MSLNDELKAILDKRLHEINGRDIVSAQEITDLLLDIRLLLMTEDVTTINT